MKKEEKIWLAGVLEARGVVGIYNGSCVVRTTYQDKSFIDYMHSLIPGHDYVIQRKGREDSYFW